MTKRALRLIELDGDQDPLRAAWFWSQRSRLVEDLGRGDGWEELAGPGPGPRAAAVGRARRGARAHRGLDHGPQPQRGGRHRRRARGRFARQSGARDTELQARVTLGVLQADMGGIDGGLAQVEEVLRLVRDQPAPSIVARTYGNLASVLEGAGRSAEGVRVSREGQTLIGKHVSGTTRAWLLANEGESLVAMAARGGGRAVGEAKRLVDELFLRAGSELQFGFLALGVGDVEAAAGHYASAAEGLRRDTQPQHQIPLRMLGLRLALAQGRTADARANCSARSSRASRPAPPVSPGRC